MFLKIKILKLACMIISKIYGKLFILFGPMIRHSLSMINEKTRNIGRFHCKGRKEHSRRLQSCYCCATSSAFSNIGFRFRAAPGIVDPFRAFLSGLPVVRSTIG